LINTFIFLRARIKHILSLPADTPLSSASSSKRTLDEPEPWRIGLGAGGANGKGKEKDIWTGFTFAVPSFHDDVFWDCELSGLLAEHSPDPSIGKDVIVSSEMQILKRLGFNMQVRQMTAMSSYACS
jgi:hypothetical protein